MSRRFTFRPLARKLWHQGKYPTFLNAIYLLYTAHIICSIFAHQLLNFENKYLDHCNNSAAELSNAAVNFRSGNNFTDKELVARVLSGDAGAFGVIVKNTERLVAQIIFKMISHEEERKDIAQDVYLKVFRQLSSFRFQSKLSTWIAQVAYYACLNFLEKKKLVLPGGVHDDESQDEMLDRLSVPLMDMSGATERLLSRKELTGILQEEIGQLSPVYRTLIVLYHQEEMSYDEMGQITGLPEGTIKNYLFRARKALRESISAKYKIDELW